jgi:hypothetical protein
MSWLPNLVLSLAVLQSTLATAQPREVLILTNVNVVDTRFGAIQPYRTVVIREGRIAAVARYAMIQEGSHVRIVNATGKYLIPGLWDMHVHTAGSPSAAWDEQIIYPLYIANGVTGVRDMGGDPALLRERRERIVHGDLPGPHILMAGSVLNGGEDDAEPIAVNNPSEARMAVDAIKKQGADFVKIPSNLSRGSYFAIVDEARKSHLTVVGFLPDAVNVKEASVAGQRSLEHMAGIMLACSSKEFELRQRLIDDAASNNFEDYQRAEVESIASYDRDKALSLFFQLTDNFTWQVPTLSWWHASAVLGDPIAASDPRARYVPVAAPSGVGHDEPRQSAAPKQVARRYLELAGAMRHAGVPFLAGTDSPDTNVVPGFSLHEELELMTEAGFTNLEALQTATLNPAQFQQRLDQYGVVEKERVADLVVLDGNPLADIRNTRKINAVILGGKFFDRSQLDHILNAVAERAQVERAQQRADDSRAQATTSKR